MAHYNSNKIRTIIESLATIYGIPMSRWHVTYGTAMVVHGLVTTTQDIDVSLNEEDWIQFTQYCEVDSDSLGTIVSLPGKIEIRSLEYLPHETTFVRHHGFMVADLESLHNAYRSMVEVPLSHREKLEQDKARVVLLESTINWKRKRGDAELRRDCDMVTECAMDLVIGTNMAHTFSKVGLRNTDYFGEVKDSAKDTWSYMISHTEPVIEIEHEKMGNRYRVRVERI